MRTVENPPNPFEHAHLEWDGPAPPAKLEVFEETCKSALARNDSPDIPFRYSLNPYRGCFHACAYCYARPTHGYWGFGAGTDFDRRIVVKTNIAERLEHTFKSKRWQGDVIAFSGNTDCYQPLEANYGLTRQCLELCLAYQNPVQLITKSKLVRRDIDLLRALSERAHCSVVLSVPFADDAMARHIEPFASPPRKRFETIRLLTEAGIEVGVSIGPIIPGLNDDQIPKIIEAAANAGASFAFPILLRLDEQVAPIFEARLREAYPLRVDKVMNQLRETRGGLLKNPRFGKRMVGQGPRWQAIELLFRQSCTRHGIAGMDETRYGLQHIKTTFERPTRQLSLL